MSSSLNEQLRAARSASRLSQQEIAEALGWNRAHVSNVERGSSDTTLSAAAQWAAACGYEIVLVPKDTADPEGLSRLCASIRDPAARDVVARLARLVRWPHRYWMHFRDDFEHAERRAIRDAEMESAPPR